MFWKHQRLQRNSNKHRNSSVKWSRLGLRQYIFIKKTWHLLRFNDNLLKNSQFVSCLQEYYRLTKIFLFLLLQRLSLGIISHKGSLVVILNYIYIRWLVDVHTKFLVTSLTTYSSTCSWSFLMNTRLEAQYSM